MSTTENVYYLKKGELFSVINGIKRPVSPEEIIADKEKTSLLIDDDYFFYVGMDNVSVTGKKLHSVAGNYLSLMFPGDLVKNFGVYQGKGYTVVFILSDEISSLINEYPELFSSVKKITTPFIEFASRYDDFVFSDGSRMYKKSGAEITAAQSDEASVTADDLFSELSAPVTSMQIPGVVKSKFSKTPYIIPAAIVGVCYIIFLIGQIASLSAISKTEKYYQDMLQNVYKSAGVNKSGDPYGLLLYKANQAKKGFSGKRVMTIISELKDIAGNNTELYTMSIRDKSVRIDGLATDFAQVENLKKAAEEKLKTSVSMDDTKKTDNGVTFVMRYEQ